MMTDILGFVAAAAIITFSGTQLSRHGDRLAELTGLSKAWIGLILMATVTSLPELITALSAVIVVKAPDLAMGNILGSCAFNLLLLSVLDVMVKKPITSLVKPGHLVAGSFSIILLTTSGIGILLSHQVPLLAWISPFSFLLVLIYMLAVRGIFQHERSQLTRGETRDFKGATVSSSEITQLDNPARRRELLRSMLVYSGHAVVVIAAALFLPYFGENIAQKTGLSDTFFGTLFLAIATSLPELVISISAVRLGSLDMAMGNLLGSNLFNIFVLSITDVFYAGGSLFAVVSSTHLLSILASVMMTAVVALGLVIRPEKKVWRLSMDSLTILIIYLLLILVIL